LDSKFPVWYPYYGSWIAAILFETVLLVGPSLLHRPMDAYDFISISISSLRVCDFMVLACVYFAAWNRKETYETDDAERQPLLRSELAPEVLSSEESGQDANEPVETDDLSDDGSQRKTDEEQASEDFWFKRQRENKEMISKRLKADGNWWTYLKGFSVRTSCSVYVGSDNSCLRLTRSSSHIFGPFTARLCSFELYLPDFACF